MSYKIEGAVRPNRVPHWIGKRLSDCGKVYIHGPYKVGANHWNVLVEELKRKSHQVKGVLYSRPTYGEWD